jgi:hypothetical protein
LDTLIALICTCFIAAKTLSSSQYQANIGPFLLVCPLLVSLTVESFLAGLYPKKHYGTGLIGSILSRNISSPVGQATIPLGDNRFYQA